MLEIISAKKEKNRVLTYHSITGDYDNKSIKTGNFKKLVDKI